MPEEFQLEDNYSLEENESKESLISDDVLVSEDELGELEKKFRAEFGHLLDKDIEVEEDVDERSFEEKLIPNHYKDNNSEIALDLLDEDNLQQGKNLIEEKQYSIEYSVFEPGGDPMFEFEELAGIKEFSELSKEEYSFVWFYANETSLYNSIEDKRTRLYTCWNAAFKKSMNVEEKNRYLSGNFPEKIKRAINRMKQINCNIRFRAKISLYSAFRNLEIMVNKKPSDVVMMDMDDAKKYSDLVKQASVTMKEIIEKLETGFGVKTKNVIDVKNIISPMQKIINRE